MRGVLIWALLCAGCATEGNTDTLTDGFEEAAPLPGAISNDNVADPSATQAQPPSPSPNVPSPSAPETEPEAPESDEPSSPNGGSAPSPTEPDAAVTSEPQVFQDITHRFQGNVAKLRYGIAITDIDGDQDFEAVVTGYGGANEIWDFSEGAFVDVSPQAVKDSERRAIGVSACDMDGDGREELYFLNVDRFGGLGDVSDRLFRRTETGWVDVFESDENLASVNRFSGRSVMCFDRDGDGRYGIFVANYGGPMKLFEVDDSWRLSDQAPALGMALTTGGRSLVNLPGDTGQMQLFAGNENGPNFFFVGRNPDYQEVALDFGVADRLNTVRGVAVLDANEDGQFDLVYGNWNGDHRLFLNEGDRFRDVAPAEMAVPSRIRTVIAADFDNDGYEEIFWNQIGQPNRLFKKVNGAWTSVDLGPALEPEGLGTGAAVVDMDNDGQLELLIAHGESGEQPLSAFRWGRNSNGYLRVQPLTQHGGPARGATVSLRTQTRTQRRVIDAGSGYLCQMEPIAHFGLGQVSGPVTIEVRWPDGSQQTVNEVEPNQVLVVPYPEGA